MDKHLHRHRPQLEVTRSVHEALQPKAPGDELSLSFFQTAAFITDFHRWVSTRKKKKKEETAPGNSRPSSNALSHEQVEVCVRTDKGRALVVGAPDRSDPPPVCDLRARKLERHKCPGVGDNRLVSHQSAQVSDAQHCDRRGGARELTISLNCVERTSGFVDLPTEPAGAAAPVRHSGEAEGRDAHETRSARSHRCCCW